jgi:3-oxoadipate CoA-transferase alpha subunit
MIDKRVASLADAVAGILDGSSVMIGGFGAVGQPNQLIDALLDQGAKELTLIANNAGWGHETGIPRLLDNNRVKHIICTYPKGSVAFADLYRAGKISYELVPQGTLAERIRAGGAGIPAFFTPTGANTRVQEGKEVRYFNGRAHLLETALNADVALCEAYQADRWGNLVYRGSGRNFNPLMATAAKLTIVQASEVVDLGGLDPERVVTPGLFVDRVVHVPR